MVRGIIDSNAYERRPNGSYIVGSGLMKKWKSQIRHSDPALFRKIATAKALPKIKIRGMGKNGNQCYKMGGAYIMGGGLFSRLWRKVKKVAKNVGKKVYNAARKEVTGVYNDIKKIRKPSDVLDLVDKVKGRVSDLTSTSYWRKQAERAGLKKAGLGRRRMMGNGRRRRRRPWADAPGPGRVSRAGYRVHRRLRCGQRESGQGPFRGDLRRAEQHGPFLRRTPPGRAGRSGDDPRRAG